MVVFWHKIPKTLTPGATALQIQFSICLKSFCIHLANLLLRFGSYDHLVEVVMYHAVDEGLMLGMPCPQRRDEPAKVGPGPLHQ